MILGTCQSLVQREEGIINMILCHHPPEWLYDGNDVKTDLLARASILLFGHKHQFESTKVGNSLILAAGAMQPSRAETNWEPRYNVIQLNTAINQADRILKTKIWKRVWKKSKRKFVPDYDEKSEFEEHDFIIEKIEHHKTETETIAAEKFEDDGDKTEKIELINVNMPSPVRKLAYLFLSLPYHKKLKVAMDLDLIEDSDKDLNEIQKSQAYFKRAHEKNLLAKLWQLTSVASGQEGIENPFT